MKQSIRLLLLLVCTFLPITSLQAVRVYGKVKIPQDSQFPDQGLDVVLLKFGINDSGQIETQGPVARSKTDANGLFEFGKITPETNVAYRIGSRFEGSLISSDFVFLARNQEEQYIEVIVPSVVESVEELKIGNSAIFIELSEPGKLWITEAIYVNNPLNDIISAENNPFEMRLVGSPKKFQMLSEPANSQNFEQLGATLRLFKAFPSGENAVAFRYQISAPLGEHRLTKRYANPPELAKVLLPLKVLNIESPQLKMATTEQVGNMVFRSWTFDNPQDAVEFTLKNIPTNQLLVYGFGGGAVLFILLLCLAGFVLIRLNNRQQSTTED